MIVGNILKDIYLNIDSRTEKFEVDEDGVRSLKFGFNASQHHFFRRISSFSGAAVSLEVLEKMGVDVSVSGSNIKFGGDSVSFKEAPGAYRYILVSDGEATYLTPSSTCISNFTEPKEPVDYIYIDRSVELNESVTKRIENYLDKNKEVKLAIFAKASEEFFERRLMKRASLIFSDHPLLDVPEDKVVTISEQQLSYLGVSEPVFVKRADIATHLSLYSVAAATVLGGLLLGRHTGQVLKLARANMENAKIDAALSLNTLTEIAAEYHDKVDDEFELIAGTLTMPDHAIINALTEKDLEKEQQIRPSGVALSPEMLDKFTDDGFSYVDYVTNKRLVPGVLLEKFTLNTNLGEFYQMGLRFVKWNLDFETEIEESKKTVFLQKIALATKAKLVPVVMVESKLDADAAVKYLSNLLNGEKPAFRAAIIEIKNKAYLV